MKGRADRSGCPCGQSTCSCTKNCGCSPGCIESCCVYQPVVKKRAPGQPKREPGTKSPSKKINYRKKKK